MALTMAELCAGSGGLHLAASLLWPNLPLSWVAENDPDASRVLATRLGVPNHGDITEIDWTTVEPVDILAGGWPCQPYSLAGKRKGHDDDRAIWPAFADAIRVLRPRLFLGENVPGILARGQLGRVVAELAGLGYVGSWLCLRASAVGAPHQRNRVFLAARPAADPGGVDLRLQPEPVGAREGSGGVAVWRQTTSRRGKPGEELIRAPRDLMPTPTANLGRGAGLPTESAAARYMTGRRMLDDAVALLPTPTAKDSAGEPRRIQPRTHDGTDFGPCLRDVAIHHANRWAQYGPAIARWEAATGRLAPEPTVIGKRGGRRLSARFVEWMMGLPDGWVTSIVDNTAALRILGNGVVPQQGAFAYESLVA